MSATLEALRRTISGSLKTEEFTKALGQAAFLLTLSKDHRDRDMAWLEANVTTPLALRQMQVMTHGKQPIAFVTWAWASDVVSSRIEVGDTTLALPDWRSGPSMVVVKCVSPLADRAHILSEFHKNFKAAETALQ